MRRDSGVPAHLGSGLLFCGQLGVDRNRCLATSKRLDAVPPTGIVCRLVSPAYFRVLGLRLRRGRALSDLDRDDAPLVVVINDTMARKYFANGDPVGQRLLMDRPGFGTVYSGEASSFEIVGVIADERLTPFDDTRGHAAVYVSNEQDSRGFAGIVIRTSLEPSRMERGLREAVAAVDKDQRVTTSWPAPSTTGWASPAFTVPG